MKKPSEKRNCSARSKMKMSPGIKVPVLLLNDLEDVDETGELHRCPGHEVVRVFLKLMKVHSRASFFQQVELKLIISTIIEILANTLEISSFNSRVPSSTYLYLSIKLSISCPTQTDVCL